jgi:hypothetical protein
MTLEHACAAAPHHVMRGAKQSISHRLPELICAPAHPRLCPGLRRVWLEQRRPAALAQLGSRPDTTKNIWVRREDDVIAITEITFLCGGSKRTAGFPLLTPTQRPQRDEQWKVRDSSRHLEGDRRSRSSSQALNAD